MKNIKVYVLLIVLIGTGCFIDYKYKQYKENEFNKQYGIHQEENEKIDWSAYEKEQEEKELNQIPECKLCKLNKHFLEFYLKDGTFSSEKDNSLNENNSLCELHKEERAQTLKAFTDDNSKEKDCPICSGDQARTPGYRIEGNDLNPIFNIYQLIECMENYVKTELIEYIDIPKGEQLDLHKEVYESITGDREFYSLCPHCMEKLNEYKNYDL